MFYLLTQVEVVHVCSLCGNVSRYTLLFLKKSLWEYSCFKMLISAVQQSASAIHIHISPCFWISFPLSSSKSIEFPVLHSRCSLLIQFICSIHCVYMSILISPIPPIPSFPPPKLSSDLCTLKICYSVMKQQFSKYCIQVSTSQYF